ncbi:MAG: ATP-binding protein [Ornithinimicrobium sp.]
MIRTRRQHWGLAPRLLSATTAIVLVGSATAWVVAVTLGPSIFHDHLADNRTTEIRHAEDAFRTASALTVALALFAALLASIAVSIFLTRRVSHSLALVTTAAQRVATGDHEARVPHVGMGREFDALTETFNGMATDLGHIEATRTRILADLAHEMRTPVATLDGYLEAIGDGVRRADEETVDMLRSQVARLARLGEDIALVTTAEEGRWSLRRVRTPLSEIVEVAHAQAARRYLDAGVSLDVQMAADISDGAVVDVDPDRVGQVLTNLLDNALRHTPRGGRVRLVTDRAEASVVVRVIDGGDGIPREHLPRVFDRFYRVDTARDRSQGGSGVGLAIVQAIVRAHGGTVTATSEGAGQGSTFTVTLPVTRSVTVDP